MKTFRRGLVVGKFAPLHRGHEWLIERALAECEEVYLISYSNPEPPGCPPERRAGWLAARFPQTHRLVLTAAECPENAAEDRWHRRFCARLCRDHWGVFVDAVFTSENYGRGFAEELTTYFRESDPSVPAVCAVLGDLDRVGISISGSAIRQNVHAHRAWLHPEVYADFVSRVVFLGGESTGKSTLVAALAERFKTVAVAEYGRQLWEERGGALRWEDMDRIVERQVHAEEAACRHAHRYVFCDTSPLTTLFYSQALFGRVSPHVEIAARRPYDLIVLCGADFPFVQDGTRRDAAFREQQQAWYRRELTARGWAWQEVDGSLETRLSAVEKLLGQSAN